MAESLSIWLKIAGTLSLIFGISGLTSVAFDPYYWYRGILGFLWLVSGLLNFITVSGKTTTLAKLNLYGMWIAVIGGLAINIYIVLMTGALSKGYCAEIGLNPADEETCGPYGTLLYSISGTLIAIIILVFAPLSYLVGKYKNQIESSQSPVISLIDSI